MVMIVGKISAPQGNKLEELDYPEFQNVGK